MDQGTFNQYSGFVILNNTRDLKGCTVISTLKYLLLWLLRQRDEPVLGQGPGGVGELRARLAEMRPAGGAVERGRVSLILVAGNARRGGRGLCRD